MSISITIANRIPNLTLHHPSPLQYLEDETPLFRSILPPVSGMVLAGCVSVAFVHKFRIIEQNYMTPLNVQNYLTNKIVCSTFPLSSFASLRQKWGSQP